MLYLLAFFIRLFNKAARRRLHFQNYVDLIRNLYTESQHLGVPSIYDIPSIFSSVSLRAMYISFIYEPAQKLSKLYTPALPRAVCRARRTVRCEEVFPPVSDTECLSDWASYRSLSDFSSCCLAAARRADASLCCCAAVLLLFSYSFIYACRFRQSLCEAEYPCMQDA